MLQRLFYSILQTDNLFFSQVPCDSVTHASTVRHQSIPRRPNNPIHNRITLLLIFSALSRCRKRVGRICRRVENGWGWKGEAALA